MTETSLSLLERLQTQSDSVSWQKLVDIYAPLIARWLSRSPLQRADHEDLVQEVLKIVVQKLPDFERRREGSFRAWLRVVSVNCLREFWRSSKRQPVATGDSNFLQQLQELEDPHSALTQAWETEHDLYLVRRLLELIEPKFEPTHYCAKENMWRRCRSWREFSNSTRGMERPWPTWPGLWRTLNHPMPPLPAYQEC